VISDKDEIIADKDASIVNKNAINQIKICYLSRSIYIAGENQNKNCMI
jgi:hypothetical protein